MFGTDRVFLDVGDIEAGDDFSAVIEERLRLAAVFIVLIGRDWLRVQDRFGRRRIDGDKDWVRHEIREALAKVGCTIIPLLLDDTELPDEEEALPKDIARLLTLQRARFRQAESHDDIEVLSKTIEQCGFTRLTASNSNVRSGAAEFTDEQVNDVVVRLQHARENAGVEFVGGRELVIELDQLFNRKTFRFETLRGCPEQRWAVRLDSAYQTLRVLRMFMRNVRETVPDKYEIYIEVLKEVEKYCMQMGTLLFDPPVDFDAIELQIGKSTFKAQLPAQIRFPVGPDRQPEISDVINEHIDPHRARAVELMDQFAKHSA